MDARAYRIRYPQQFISSRKLWFSYNHVTRVPYSILSFRHTMDRGQQASQTDTDGSRCQEHAHSIYYQQNPIQILP
jgi:hypothetical protein